MGKIIISGSENENADFTCDGKNDHIQITEALAFAAKTSDSVYLEGPFKYRIGDTIRYQQGNIILEGDSSAVLTIHTDKLWPSMKPLIGQVNPTRAKKGKFVIRGFEIDGQADTLNNNFAAAQGKTELRGDGYYNMLYVFYDDVEFHDMYLHDSLGDGLRIKYSDGIKFYNNRVYKLGHDVVYAIQCQNVEVWKNNVRTKTNSASRMFNANHVKIHDNFIWTVLEGDGGGPGLQIQYGRESTKNIIMNDVEIYNNVFQDTYGPGIALVGYLNGGSSYDKSEACNVHIHHNKFYGCGTHPSILWTAAIITSGFHKTLIENNVFDGNYHAGVALQNNAGVKSPGTGYTITVKKNIFVNMKKRKGTPTGTGNGVTNNLPGTHSFILDENCFYNNAGPDYVNASGSDSDIYLDPLFVDQAKHDYHLKSVAGHWTPNGYILDSETSPCLFKDHELGMYDGTAEASRYSNEDPVKIPSILVFSCSPEQTEELKRSMPGRQILKEFNEVLKND